MQRPDQRLVIWRLSDGKPGHDNQSRGLFQALGRLHPSDVIDIPVCENRPGLLDLLLKRFPAVRQYANPDLIIGAGHATHLPMLIARRARGGRSIVLMKPSLPLKLFDLCLIPEHDKPVAGDNVLPTLGALNTIRHADQSSLDAGLFLIGGPSAHHGWNEDAIISAICQISDVQHGMGWQLTDSRRTPASTRDRLEALNRQGLDYTPCEKTPAGWVPEQLAKCGRVWVTADSVSMIYEALTAGAATGLIEVPVSRTDRITRGLDKLLETHQLTTFSAWKQGQTLRKPATQLAEADRCAAAISQRWLA